MSISKKIVSSFLTISAFLVVASSVAIINFNTVKASAADEPGYTQPPPPDRNFVYDPSAVAYPAVDYSDVPNIYSYSDGVQVQYIEFEPLHIIISGLNK
jgi:hypothetical protein